MSRDLKFEFTWPKPANTRPALTRFLAKFRGKSVNLTKKIKIISERRRETRRLASRWSMQKASFYSHMGKQNNIITREKLILATWSIEQKVIVSWCRTDICDELARPEPARPGPVRPWRSLTAYFSNLLKNKKLKLSHNIFTGLKTVALKFHIHFFISSEAIAFFAKTEFLHFYIHFCVLLEHN